MTKRLMPALLIVALTGCGNPEPATIERQGQPDIEMISEEDREMNAAISKAQQTLGRFDRALHSENPELYAFALKVRYETPAGGEHIWITDVVYDSSGQYYGIIGNVPEYASGIRLGDTVLIDKSAISDWKYLEGRNMHGGYTSRVLRDRMPEAERRSLDSAYGVPVTE